MNQSIRSALGKPGVRFTPGRVPWTAQGSHSPHVVISAQRDVTQPRDDKGSSSDGIREFRLRTAMLPTGYSRVPNVLERAWARPKTPMQGGALSYRSDSLTMEVSPRREQLVKLSSLSLTLAGPSRNCRRPVSLIL